MSRGGPAAGGPSGASRGGHSLGPRGGRSARSASTMTLPVRFLPEAKSEFDDAADWYEKKRAGLGVDFVNKVGDVIRRISLNPRLHQIIYRDVRRAVVARFPYVVLYREEG